MRKEITTIKWWERIILLFIPTETIISLDGAWDFKFFRGKIYFLKFHAPKFNGAKFDKIFFDELRGEGMKVNINIKNTDPLACSNCQATAWGRSILVDDVRNPHCIKCGREVLMPDVTNAN